MGLLFNNAEVLLCIPAKEKEMAKGLVGKTTATAGSRSDPLRSRGQHGEVLLSLPIPTWADPCQRCSLSLQSLSFRWGTGFPRLASALTFTAASTGNGAAKLLSKAHRQQAFSPIILFARAPWICGCSSNSKHISSTAENSALQHPSPDRPHSSGPAVTSDRAACSLAPLTYTHTANTWEVLTGTSISGETVKSLLSQVNTSSFLTIKAFISTVV